MLILRSTAGQGELDTGSAKCCLAESSRHPQHKPNKAAVCGALDPSLGAAEGKWTEFLLNQAHSESSQVFWTLSLENTTIGYQPTVRAVDKHPLIWSLVKLKFAGYLKG